MDEKAKIDLRPAREDDFDFLWQLHRDELQEYVAAIWGWDEGWQLDRFREHFDPGKREIILYQGQTAGTVGVEWQVDALYLAYIAINSAYQGRGLGTAILQRLIREAGERELPLTLTVLRGNPAKRLYERLGFVVTKESEIRFWMACLW